MGLLYLQHKTPILNKRQSVILNRSAVNANIKQVPHHCKNDDIKKIPYVSYEYLIHGAVH